MEDQYGIADLRQYVSARPSFFPPPPPPPDLISGHRGLGQPHPYDQLLVFRSESAASVPPPPPPQIAGCFESGSGGAGRWPRQETLTLLEIRSRLDPKFKEANQKGPLWDDVSRIMSEEHGYQRSGKKCREKFENLYKYYKKTKEGKAGRQDGKHYRFFRQLEALYGETNNVNASAGHHPTIPTDNYPYNNNNNQETSTQCPKQVSDNTTSCSLSLSNYSEPGGGTTSSSEAEGEAGWKSRVKGFVDEQMKRMMEKQEAWMERTMAAIEHKERERLSREEAWRKQDTDRVDREHKFWAGERAWIEARDAALMDALRKLTKPIDNTWAADPAAKFEGGNSVFWDEVASKMGHDAIKSNKKRRENSRSGGGYININNYDHQGGVYCGNGDHHQQVQGVNDNGLSSESCFRYFMGDATNYGRIMED